MIFEGHFIYYKLVLLRQPSVSQKCSIYRVQN